MAADFAARRRRFVSVAALVALACAAPGCDAILGPSSVDSNWRITETPHFLLHARPGSFADQNVARLAEVLEDQYAFALQTLEARYSGRISMFMYESGADAGMQGERSGKAYPDTEAVRAVVSPPLESTYGLLAHEANHVIEHLALGPPATSFINEGSASAFLSERYYVGGKTYLWTWTAQRLAQIPALSILVDDSKWGDYDSQLAYNSSASFLAYLVDQFGAARFKQLQSVDSSAFPGRFQEIYGRSLDQADSDWRAFCAAFRP